MLANLHPAQTPASALLAIDDQGLSVSYGDLDGLRNRWANALSGRRLVALLCENTVPSLCAYIGLQSAGHVVILLSAKIAEQALQDLIKKYEIEAIVRPDASLEVLSEPNGGLHNDLSICLSTSGSTGSPKLVRFSFAQLQANAKAIAEYLQLTSSQKPLAHLPYEYSFGLSVLHSHMFVGATILLSQTTVMQKPFWERLAQATSFSGVPFHFEMLLRMRIERKDIPNLEVLTQAGGKLSQDLATKIHEIAGQKNWKFHIMYGQTEAGPRISWLPHNLMHENYECIGQPIPGVSLSTKTDGELIVESPSIMLGYAQSRSDLAIGDEMNGVLQTGDLAEKLQNGFYRITGRKNRFIKVQGNRVSLDDVESMMKNAGHIVYASGSDDQLVLFSQSENIDSLRASAVRLFTFPPRSMQVRHLDALPRRSNEKIDYGMLLKLATQKDPA